MKIKKIVAGAMIGCLLLSSIQPIIAKKNRNPIKGIAVGAAVGAGAVIATAVTFLGLFFGASAIGDCIEGIVKIGACVGAGGAVAGGIVAASKQNYSSTKKKKTRRSRRKKRKKISEPEIQEIIEISENSVELQENNEENAIEESIAADLDQIELEETSEEKTDKNNNSEIVLEKSIEEIDLVTDSK